jgi:hypothetical protein
MFYAWDASAVRDKVVAAGTERGLAAKFLSQQGFESRETVASEFIINYKLARVLGSIPRLRSARLTKP